MSFVLITDPHEESKSALHGLIINYECKAPTRKSLGTKAL